MQKVEVSVPPVVHRLVYGPLEAPLQGFRLMISVLMAPLMGTQLLEIYAIGYLLVQFLGEL